MKAAVALGMALTMTVTGASAVFAVERLSALLLISRLRLWYRGLHPRRMHLWY